MIKEKILLREQVVAHIVGVYVSKCSQWLNGNDEEYIKQEKLKKKIFKGVNVHHITIPKWIISFSDLKNIAIFTGYSNKEKMELFEETIMRAGFTTYSLGKQKYYGFAF